MAVRRPWVGSFETAQAATAGQRLSTALKPAFNSVGGVAISEESGAPDRSRPSASPFIVKQSMSFAIRRLPCSCPCSSDHFQHADQLRHSPANADDRGGLGLQFRPTQQAKEWRHRAEERRGTIPPGH